MEFLSSGLSLVAEHVDAAIPALATVAGVWLAERIRSKRRKTLSDACQQSVNVNVELNISRNADEADDLRD